MIIVLVSVYGVVSGTCNDDIISGAAVDDIVAMVLGGKLINIIVSPDLIIAVTTGEDVIIALTDDDIITRSAVNNIFAVDGSVPGLTAFITEKQVVLRSPVNGIVPSAACNLIFTGTTRKDVVSVLLTGEIVQ